MANMTMEQMQEIDSVLEENKTLKQKVQEISSRLSAEISEKMQYKSFILNNRNIWIELYKKEMQIQSAENQIQSTETRLNMREESIAASERRLKAEQKSVNDLRSDLCRIQSNIEAAKKNLSRKESDFNREKTALQEEIKALEKRKKDVASRENEINQDLTQLYNITKMTAEQEYERIYPITRDLLIFFTAAMIVSAFSGCFARDFVEMISSVCSAFAALITAIHNLGMHLGHDITILHILSMAILGWVVPILIPVIPLGGIGYLIYRLYSKFLDDASRIFLFADLTVCVCAGNLLKVIPILHINTVVLFLILQAIYLIVRTIIWRRDPLRDLKPW